MAATVEVSGPLDAPEFVPRRGSLVTSALGSIFVNALRPVTTLTKLTALDRLIRRRKAGDEDAGPCDQIVRKRIEQIRTSQFELIDLDKIADERDLRSPPKSEPR